MTTLGLEGVGVTVQFGSSGFVADVISIALSERAREAIETTHLGTQKAKTYKPGQRPDLGTIGLIFDAQPGEVNLLQSGVETLTITYPDDPDDPTRLVVQGFAIAQGGHEMRVDQRMVTKITFRLTAIGDGGIPVGALLDESGDALLDESGAAILEE
jgi:hypothetical protein